MDTKTGPHGTEIQFSSISPLELWERLGLAQPSVKKEPRRTELNLFPTQFLSEEDMRAYAAFMEDCPLFDDYEMEDVITISPAKGSLFLWALLQENGKRSRKAKKLSSINHILKDDMWSTIRRKGKKVKVPFEEEDFDTIASFLQKKNLVRTSKEAIRITRMFTKLFHEKYKAWVVF